MSNLNDLSVLPLPAGPALNADETDSRLSLTLEGQPLIRLRLERGDEVQVHLQEPASVPAARACGQRVIGCLPGSPGASDWSGVLSMRRKMPCAVGCWWRPGLPGSFIASARCSGSCRNRGWGNLSRGLIRSR